MSAVPPHMGRTIKQEVKAQLELEIGDIDARFLQLENEMESRVDGIHKEVVEPLEAEKKRLEEELSKIREENTKRQRAEEKMREELWGVIRKMQGEIEELREGQVQRNVKAKRDLRKEPEKTAEEQADSEAYELSSRSMTEPASRQENAQNYTSSALVPFSSQVDKNTGALNAKGFGPHGTQGSMASNLDLTTRPANRGQQRVASVQSTRRESNSVDSEPSAPATNRRSPMGLSYLTSDGEGDNYSESTTSEVPETFIKKGPASQPSLRPGRQSHGTAAAKTSRSRSPRPSLDANFRVRDGSRPVQKSNPGSSRRRSSSSLSVERIPNDDHDNDSSFHSIPSRFQPSRRTKSTNELVDKHLSFIPNGWRTILANTAKQLSDEDWDRSDAQVLKKLEEHCPAFSTLEELLPDVKMAVPALRGLMRDLGRHP